MKFGIATFVTDESISPLVLGPALEERGFDSVFLAEHSHIPVSRQTPLSARRRPAAQVLPDPGSFRRADRDGSASTRNLLVGTGIALLPQRDVIHLAKEVASVDLVSGGRFQFGVGVGWNREEMRNHGTDPRTRGALMDEMLAALVQIWTTEQAQFHGQYVDFDPIFAWPKPVQQPHPPIYVGGESDAALARLARFGDAWFPRSNTSPDKLRQVREWLADAGSPGRAIHHFRGRKGPGEARRLRRGRRRTDHFPARDIAGNRDARRAGCVGPAGIWQLTWTLTDIDRQLDRIGAQPFRAKFHLRGREREMVQRLGPLTIRRHTVDFIAARLAPAAPAKDGKQTPLPRPPGIRHPARDGDLLSELPGPLARHCQGRRIERRGAGVGGRHHRPLD